MKREKIYPDSGVELSPFISRNYDRILALASLGHYPKSISQAIGDMHIQPDDRILDLGCGTGYNSRLMASHLTSKGSIHGLDISDEMALQFQTRFSEDNRITFENQRIDLPFQLNKKFNKVFIGFVIHGFPHHVRHTIIENAYDHLETGGSFYILDFAEFDMNSMPFHHRAVFKAVECKYAFD
ncbi:MAG: class I SAM-dependent methyltransferase, partial [Bacteroidales bacterium]|nr:class I SAM-dependent methyltransferase [Bacteroidales bacterium]